jgi:choline dehydrogenase
MAPPNPRLSAADVVVVGGGAAGCVIAARLAEASSRSVLLLEAGPDLRADLPDDFRDGWDINREDFDWHYISEADAQGVESPVRRKKLIGGTSWLTRFTPRGSPADYDAWEALGNAGWSWDDVLPYFVRLETDDDFGQEPWHGGHGPMPSQRYLDLPYTDVLTAGVEALEDLGFPVVKDHNRPGAVGVGRMPMNSRGGIRVSTADAYLPLGSTPANLTIRPEAEVGEVLFDGVRASAVRLVDGKTIEAGLVILCAGTYGSPAILMRSGIGPAEHLHSLDIQARVDLVGVGANLVDHPAVDLDFGYRGSGSSERLLHAIATFHSAQSSPDEPPDLMFWLTDPSGEPAEFGLSIVLLKPRSRGQVRLRSRDPRAAPVIRLPQLDEPTDVARLAEGYRRALKVAKHPEIRRLCDRVPAEPRSEEDLRVLIRIGAWSVPHTVGTCAMGMRPEDGAVVDTNGRVHGAERLLVADASIMPDVPSGFTLIPTIMIAERLAEQVASSV